ncbi:hypothetical protein DFH11DRAFT_1599574 [Phellopilus nigrolimitatus]|nr:hypothetical protein DFH11DRAFT_1599574 [Phellopilus nigrolimitatus]
MKTFSGKFSCNSSTLTTTLCRFWRTVALACPDLWKYIMPMHINDLERIMARTTKIPLIARFHKLSNWNDEVMEKVRELLPRIEELELVTYGSRGNSFEPIISMDWSNSQIKRVIFQADKSASEPQLVAKGGLVKIHLPKPLQCLTLDRAIVPSGSPIYAGLTELVLSHINSLTADELRSVLKQSPQLKFLSLIDAGPKTSDQKLPLSLSSLEELVFRGRPEGANALFGILDIPSSAKWTSTLLTNFDYTYQSIDDTLQLVPSPVPTDEMGSQVFSVWMNKSSVKLTTKPKCSNLHTFALVPASVGTSSVLLAHLPAAMLCAKWTHVTSLELIFTYDGAAESARGSGWYSLLSALPALEALRVCTTSVSQQHAAPAYALSALMRVLARCDVKEVRKSDPYYFPINLLDGLEESVKMNAGEETGPGDLLCPKLAELKLDTRENFQSLIPVKAMELWEPLLAAVRDRHTAHVPLRKLCIASSSMLSDMVVEQLKQYVDHVSTH